MTEKKQEKKPTNGFYFDQIDLMEQLNSFKETQAMVDQLSSDEEKKKVFEEVKKITDEWESMLNPLIEKLNKDAEFRKTFADQLRQKYGKK